MIDTEALRKKVIDLAIKGKLTEQLPSDGDAETLLAQILNQKSQLIKEGKIKTEKALPEITSDEIPFEVPKNWKWVRLYEISDTNIGLTYHPENIVEEGTIVLRSNNIKNGTFDYSDLVHVNCEVRDNQYIRKNDILICSRNGSKNLVGKCAIYDGKLGNVSFGAFMAILRTSLFKYVYIYLTTDAFRRYFSNDDTKQINQVTQDILKKAIVPLPPLDEQMRIIAKLDTVLSQIDIIDDLQSKYNNNLAVLKSKIIDAGIQGKLTEQLPEDGTAEELYVQIQEEKVRLIKEGKIKKEKKLPDIVADEIPFEIPKNWKWVRLGEIIKIKSGKGLTSYQMGKGDIPVYGGNGVIGYHNESLVKEETIVIGRVGVYCGSVHVTPEKAWVTDNAFITRYPKKFIDRDYLVYSLRNMNLGKNTNGAAQPVVSGKKIYPLLFALPPYDEQKRISKRIDDVLLIVDSLQ